MHGVHTTITTRVWHSTSTLPVYNNTLSIHTNRDLVVHERLAILAMVVQLVQPPFFVPISRGPTDFAFRRSVGTREIIFVLETALSLINAESVLKLSSMVHTVA